MRCSGIDAGVLRRLLTTSVLVLLWWVGLYANPVAFWLTDLRTGLAN